MIQINSLLGFSIHINKKLTRATILTRSVVVLLKRKVLELTGTCGYRYRTCN